MSLGDAEIGEYSLVAADARFGTDIRIGASVTVGPGVSIGDGVTVADGARLGAGATLEARVSVGANAILIDGSAVRAGASIGAGSVVLSGAEIGELAVVGAGAVVTRAVPRNAIVAGNPASIQGYVGTSSATALQPIRQASALAPEHDLLESAVEGVILHRLPVVRDLRGSLVAAEFEQQLPFVPRRYFLVFDVPSTEVRGEHAHRECQQFLVCVHGEVHVVADDTRRREEFVLDDNRFGLHLPAMVWATQYRYSAGSVLLVFASHAYDSAEYIRDYDDFVAERSAL